MRKIIFISLVIIAILFFNGLSFALPWLDFGNNLVWNSNSNTLTDGGLAYVNSITYLDNTTVPPPFFPPPDPVLWSNVILSISFDGNNGNDVLKIIDAGGNIWLDAELEIMNIIPNPLTGYPNPYRVKITSNNLSVATGQGSRWADEFFSTLDNSTPYPAGLIIMWSGLSSELNNGVYKVNSTAKLVPEPSTLILLGSGLLGAALYHRRKNNN